jgi:hypothetical protein
MYAVCRILAAISRNVEASMTKYRVSGFLLILAALAFAVQSASAATMATCAADFSTCYIQENVLLQFPTGFLAISGDVVLEDPSGAVSDVFRIFNDFFDTGQGTGLGTTAFLYSSDDSTPLPDPSTYSANVKFIPESTTSPQTDYLGNGTLYVLAAPEPSSWILFSIGSIALLIAHRKKAPLWKTALFLSMASVCLPAFSQELPSATPLSPSIAKFDRPLAMGPAQNAGVVTAQAAGGLAFYTANYTSLGGRQLPFNIVGKNPALGANTTTIDAIIVPVRFVFASAGGLGLDATPLASEVAGSPIFAAADYSTGGTDLGVTQYGDALLRAQYWNLPGFSRDYHVLLGGPALISTLTITVPAGVGSLYRLTGGNLVGVVQEKLFDALLNILVKNFTSPVLPIFLTDNVFLSSTGRLDSTCCALGFHASEGPPIATAHTWIYASYVESGTFVGDTVQDVYALSHEVGEWMNDPFVGAFPAGVNLIAPAVLPGQGGQCIINYESADPLEALPISFTQVTGGKTWHLTDQVFLPWYLHTSPSFSVNGFYSYLNTFPTFSTLCGPG